MALINIPTTGLWGTIAGWINTNFITLETSVRHIGWSDNIAFFSAAKGKGTSEPTWEDIGNGQYAYSFLAGDELFVHHHINHDYRLGTDAYPHVHFLVDQTMNAGEQITWRYAYVIAKGHAQGQSLTAAETIIDMTYTATGAEVAGEHIVLECSDVQAFDLIEPDTIVMARVDLLSENVTGKIFGLVADLHYQVDGITTVNKAPNFYI